jgi:hypothetical protein
VEEAGKIHALLTCLSCKKVWNRVVNSARSIYSIAKRMNANDGEGPEEFEKTRSSCTTINSYNNNTNLRVVNTR